MSSNYSPRLFGLSFVIALIFGLFTIRLIDLQIGQHSLQLARANANRLYNLRVAPPRGSIRDRFGGDLTQSSQEFWLATESSTLFGSETPLNREEALALMARQSDGLRVAYGRLYPWKDILAQTIGYVGKPSREDMQSEAVLMSSQLLGKTGLERSFNSSLEGGTGIDQFELSALGRPQRKVLSNQFDGGRVVKTSLDPYLSQVAAQAMGDNRGAVVVLDGETGEILSLISQPSFDPNLFQSTQGESDEVKQTRSQIVSKWLNADERPLFNRAVSGAYPPGSVFKPVTALAALESQAVSASTEFVDEGILKVGDFSYANWFFTQYGGTDGAIAVQRALARSNDIYFYKAAEATGPNRLAQMAKLFGFGEKTGVELPAEAAGLVPNPDWKEQQVGEKWFLGNTYHMGIGQGDVLVTPLQIASMTQTLLHRGIRCVPRLVKGEASVCEGLGFAPENLEVIVAGMIDACSPGGTAFPFFQWNDERLSEESQSIKSSDLDLSTAGGLGGEAELSDWEKGAVACKTGTAEFGGQDAQGRRNTHGWFTMGVRLPEWRSTAKGYPRSIIITVLVESDEDRPFREGSRDAAPVALEIVEWLVGTNTISGNSL